MKKKFLLTTLALLTIGSTTAQAGLFASDGTSTIEAEKVDKQQSQYAKSQPIPFFNFSLERHLLIELYRIRNQRVATHSVWRSITGVIEGDCPSITFGLPYDTSLTSPLKAVAEDTVHGWTKPSLTSVDQPEPNGIYPSKNTSATWVFCVGEGGALDPVYVETKVTAYPYPVHVDYETNRVTKAGKSSVRIK